MKGEFVLRTGDESFGATLTYSLPENIHAAIAIGGKQDVVAVWGPIRNKIVTVIECKAARVFEAMFHDGSDEKPFCGGLFQHARLVTSTVLSYFVSAPMTITVLGDRVAGH